MLRFKIKGEELRAHCLIKEKHHQEREKFYEVDKKKFEAQMAGIPKYSGDVRYGLESKLWEHKRMKEFFNRVATYIDTTKVHELDWSELEKLDL